MNRVSISLTSNSRYNTSGINSSANHLVGVNQKADSRALKQRGFAEEIRQILQVTDGADTINILATFLKAAIDGISPVEARIEVLNDVILFLKEPEYATQ